jgi:phage antirepressor YoqD-like protein
MNLIQRKNNNLLVSTDTIAKHTENEHRSVYRLIKNYESDFTEFGEVRFEIAGRQSIAMLNEDQATLLITFLKNTEKVRSFKIALVKEFKSLKQAVVETPEQLMARALISAQSVIEAKDKQLEEAKPAIELHESIVNDDHTLSMRDAGKRLQVKPNKFVEWLRSAKYLNYDNIAYQSHINSGYLVLSTTEHNGKPRTNTRVTGKGFAHFGKKIAELRFSKPDHNIFYK